MNTVVASPRMPSVKVLAKVSRPNQSASRPLTCRASKLSTLNRAISATVPPPASPPGPAPTISDTRSGRCWGYSLVLEYLTVDHGGERHVDFTENPDHKLIREAVREICARFPDE